MTLTIQNTRIHGPRNNYRTSEASGENGRAYRIVEQSFGNGFRFDYIEQRIASGQWRKMPQKRASAIWSAFTEVRDRF